MVLHQEKDDKPDRKNITNEINTIRPITMTNPAKTFFRFQNLLTHSTVLKSSS